MINGLDGVRLVVAAAVVLGAAALGTGCSDLSQKDCDKVRTDAFDILNEAHTCESDADCLMSEWPGCIKPVSRKNNERIKPLFDKFKAGKCEEPKTECRPAPEIYCKQGLCVFRELSGG